MPIDTVAGLRDRAILSIGLQVGLRRAEIGALSVRDLHQNRGFDALRVRGYSAHSMRATFIMTALENGAALEDVQKAAGHRAPSTTKLYDRRTYNPKKAAGFFAVY